MLWCGVLIKGAAEITVEGRTSDGVRSDFGSLVCLPPRSVCDAMPANHDRPTEGTADGRPLATPGRASASEGEHPLAELVDREKIMDTLKKAFEQFGARDAKFCVMEQQVHAERMNEKALLQKVAAEIAPLGFPEDVLMKEFSRGRHLMQKRLKLADVTAAPGPGMGDACEEDGARAGEALARVAQSSA